VISNGGGFDHEKSQDPHAKVLRKGTRSTTAKLYFNGNEKTERQQQTLTATAKPECSGNGEKPQA
jgi:hypothetical protein